jgi:hypothetical protein
MSEAPKEIWCSMGLYYDYKKELEAENKSLRLEAAHANDTADAAIDRIKELEATLTDIISEYDEPDNGRSLRWAIDAGRELLKGQDDE